MRAGGSFFFGGIAKKKEPKKKRCGEKIAYRNGLLTDYIAQQRYLHCCNASLRRFIILFLK